MTDLHPFCPCDHFFWSGQYSSLLMPCSISLISNQFTSAMRILLTNNQLSKKEGLFRKKVDNYLQNPRNTSSRMQTFQDFYDANSNYKESVEVRKKVLQKFSAIGQHSLVNFYAGKK